MTELFWRHSILPYSYALLQDECKTIQKNLYTLTSSEITKFFIKINIKNSESESEVTENFKTEIEI